MSPHLCVLKAQGIHDREYTQKTEQGNWKLENSNPKPKTMKAHNKYNELLHTHTQTHKEQPTKYEIQRRRMQMQIQI